MKKFIFITTLSSVLLACGRDSSEQVETVEQHQEIEVVIDTGETLKRVEKAQKVFQTIPSPMETAMLFQEAGSGYTTGLTNQIENVRNYVTSIQKSLNLGIYGADLSFANIFEQSQESMLYMNCSKILADGLGVTSAFDVATMERMEDNMNNRDSLMVLISDAFWITDAHLKDNGQNHLSALIIAGGWVEGLYLGTSSLDQTKPNKKLMQRIADQKYSLNNLVELLDTYDNVEVIDISKSLKKLQLVYNKIEIKEGKTSVSDNDGVAVIGGGNTLVYDTETILEITNSIKTIRNEIIL